MLIIKSYYFVLKMNIEHIKYIDAIVKSGSYRKASEILYISQPAISASIKKLEQELNIEIFDKKSYRAILTNDGKEFYEKAKKVLESFEKLEDFGKSLKKGVESEIKVAIDPVFDISKILSILNNTIKFYPSTKLTLEVDYMDNVVDYIRHKNFDIIICPINNIQHLDLEKEFIEEIKMYYVISPNCYLNQKEIITNDDLKLLPQVIIKTGKDTSFGIISDQRKWYVNDFFLKKQIIIQGIAYGMLPEFIIKDELENGKLVPLIKYKDFKVNNLKVYAFRNKNVKHGVVAEEIWNNFNNLLNL